MRKVQNVWGDGESGQAWASAFMLEVKCLTIENNHRGIVFSGSKCLPPPKPPFSLALAIFENLPNFAVGIFVPTSTQTPWLAWLGNRRLNRRLPFLLGGGPRKRKSDVVPSRRAVQPGPEAADAEHHHRMGDVPPDAELDEAARLRSEHLHQRHLALRDYDVQQPLQGARRVRRGEPGRHAASLGGGWREGTPDAVVTMATDAVLGTWQTQSETHP